MKGFMDFIKNQSVLGLAVGFMLGGAIQNVVSSLINNVINPMLGVVLGRTDSLGAFSFLFFGNRVMIGEFLSVLLDFMLLALIVYFLVKKAGIVKEEEIEIRR